MRVLNGIGLLAIGLLISGLTQAEVYQWRDENGNLHFSDEPPENQKSEQVELKPASGYSPPSLHREAGRDVVRDSKRSYRSSSSSSPSRALKASRTRDEARQKESRKNSCRSARDRYRNISVRNGWAYREKKDRLRKKIKEYCH
ncbi:MAG: hypothetical protein CMI09_08090 [Oceanospirillaceae bacterium]|nr:hypothetical protein [Oceanospirillaceae bacterium]|tara:strand:+ start:1479 stop:1910 length:432 start_codon:yes stop_codon:yes gene_type:complete